MSPVVSNGVAPFNGGTIDGNVEIDGHAGSTALEVNASSNVAFDSFRVRSGASSAFLIETFGGGGTGLYSDDDAIEALWVQHLKAAATVDAFVVADTGGVKQLRIGKDGQVGFYGHAPVAQQTGVAVTAAGIHAALVALGLITA